MYRISLFSDYSDDYQTLHPRQREVMEIIHSDMVHTFTDCFELAELQEFMEHCVEVPMSGPETLAVVELLTDRLGLLVELQCESGRRFAFNEQRLYVENDWEGGFNTDPDLDDPASYRAA